MKVLGNLNLLGNKLANAGLAVDDNFPADPQPGRFCFKDAILYFCTEIAGGLPVWIPLTTQLEMVEHTQSEAALEWTIPHTLNTNRPLVQVYDADGKWVIPDAILANEFNQITVRFNIPMIGSAVIMRGQTEGQPQPIVAFEQSFEDEQVWVVNHQLGYNPVVQVIIGTNVVQPQSVVHDSTMQTTITFSAPQSGTVRCV